MLTFPISSHAFNSNQELILKIAETEGQKIGYPETIQAICLQETLAGYLGRYGDKDKSKNLRSYGVMQLTLGTAKYIMEKHFKFNFFGSDDEIIEALVKNDTFNILLGRVYFKYLLDKFEGEHLQWSKAVLAYNVGPGNVRKYGLSFDPNNYLEMVKWRIKNQIRSAK
jgi:hypothetical protein